ncbi:uncharacterized protein LOC26535517 [Drosophila yakuba]|uniref:Uncharacterized protein n=1 Tax=Drosophila yakuba TaxID=7245 RepID=A0A0R1EF87_DROYA|nr:uncharacterized protein LOC26535517 [Drosophila yakuba]KRK05860.1 uncharacterized protein Dyak_GE28336 [Drosophila yakuba]
MTWIWTLFLLGFVIAQGTAQGIAEQGIAEIDGEVTKKLKSFLENFSGNWKDNTEFLNWISKIRTALNNNNTRLVDKFELRFGFESYNSDRLVLEQKISDRIEELDSIIPHQKHSKCLNFYVGQRTALKTALKQSNFIKVERFAENASSCPYYHFDDNIFLSILKA